MPCARRRLLRVEAGREDQNPLFFEAVGEPLIFFAGVWDRWRGTHKGQPAAFTSFAILTGPANPLVATVHERMPVILLPEDRETWLFGDAEEALKRLGPYPAQLMRMSPAHKNVGAVKNDHPGLMRAEPELL